MGADPSVDGSSGPNPSGGQLGFRLGKIVVCLADDVHPLSAHAEYPGDFSYADEMMSHDGNPTVDV